MSVKIRERATCEGGGGGGGYRLLAVFDRNVSTSTYECVHLKK